MMHLVAFFQATQDSNGVFLVWFIDQHFLETTLQCRIFFYVLAILVERSGTDTVQLATRESRFEHIARVHGALGFTRANHGVKFIDKQDDPALLLRQLVEYRLQALLKITTKFRTCQQ